MSDKPLPSFRSIGSPLDVDDAALDRVNAKLGVPTLTRSEPASVPRPRLNRAKHADEAALPEASRMAVAPARTASEKLTIEIPDYLGQAIRRAAVADRKTARHVVMEALKAAGFTVEDVDLVPDGRRRRS